MKDAGDGLDLIRARGGVVLYQHHPAVGIVVAPDAQLAAGYVQHLLPGAAGQRRRGGHWRRCRCRVPLEEASAKRQGLVHGATGDDLDGR